MNLKWLRPLESDGMLNITHNKIDDKIRKEDYPSLTASDTTPQIKAFTYWIYTSVSIVFILLFVPWMQIVNGLGKVTALYPTQRPQSVQSPIPGRIDRWLITEGDTVRKGDTLMLLSEIKNEYFDPEIIMRMEQELQAKDSSITAYREKVHALEDQRGFLRTNLEVKIRQTFQKIQADSNSYAAAEVKRSLSEIQFQRADTLLELGAISRFDWEKRRQVYQEAIAKAVDSRNKYRNSRSDVDAVRAEYSEKISKVGSELFSARSSALSAQAEVAKLKVKLSNLKVRRSHYTLRAPQDGLVTRIKRTGVGENIKEGESVVEFMPLNYELAVEIFVRPVDLPLVQIGQSARIEFDGWPSIVFSGWPSTSFGTFGAKVFAIDNVLDDNGKYRVLLRKDEEDVEWPSALRFGAGARGMLLLNDVALGYEVWRQLYGFPPQFYTPEKDGQKENNSYQSKGYSK